MHLDYMFRRWRRRRILLPTLVRSTIWILWGKDRTSCEERFVFILKLLTESNICLKQNLYEKIYKLVSLQTKQTNNG